MSKTIVKVGMASCGIAAGAERYTKNSKRSSKARRMSSSKRSGVLDSATWNPWLKWNRVARELPMET